MLRPLLGSKVLISALVLVLVAGTGGAGVWFLEHRERTVTYCATMPDAIGLFVGNPVTRRGVQIGTVSSVEPGDGAARVELAVDANQKLPADVGAVTVAQSLIASRQLALVGDYRGGPALRPGACITDTKTPISLTESLAGVHRLTSELTTAGGAQQWTRVQDSLRSLAAETNGTGPVVNTMISALATVLADPGPGMADLAQVLDALAPLTGGLTSNWNELRSLLMGAPGYLNNIMTPIGDTVYALADALIPVGKTLFGLMGQYGHLAWPVLDVTVPATRLVAAGVRNFGDLLGVLPPLIEAFDVQFDQPTLGLRVTYTPVQTTVFKAADPHLTCENINRIVPGQCRVIDPGHMQVDLLTVILRGIGAAR